MARKSRVTFSKMVQATEGGGDITIYVDEVFRGWIEKESDAYDVGSIQCSYVYKASNYVAVVWEKDSAADDSLEKNFEVSDYNGPRAALAAAKQWARDQLTTRPLRGALERTMATKNILENAALCGVVAPHAVAFLNGDKTARFDARVETQRLKVENSPESLFSTITPVQRAVDKLADAVWNSPLGGYSSNVESD